MSKKVKTPKEFIKDFDRSTLKGIDWFIVVTESENFEELMLAYAKYYSNVTECGCFGRYICVNCDEE